MEVKIENLVKHYGKTEAVRDISFEFGAGDIFGFIGPNGAGKTTTIEVLATLIEPTSGDAFVDGVSVSENPEKTRKLIGYMPDSLPAHNDITVHEYIDFFARAYGVPPKERKQVIEAVEAFTNLTKIKDKFLKALSKGMKQRVSLARAMVYDPPILIMDEPAAGLDPRARIELRELLKVLSDQGKAVLISSHILTELAEICTGAVIIEQGQLLKAGTIEEIQNNDTPHRTISVIVLENLDSLHKTLLQTPRIEQIRIEGNQLLFETLSSEADIAQLLTMLVQKGFKIIEFRPVKANLEDIFMNITKGLVQ